jgi:5'-3' exoribonuclease 2
MGVPALFRWLTRKYPKIITPVIEEQPVEIDGVKYPVDTTKPNPNGEELHNLYLDFNGIVHNCSHPEDKPAPANEAEMMLEMFKYTDRVVNMVRPRRVLLIAIGKSFLLSASMLVFHILQSASRLTDFQMASHPVPK